MVCFEDVLPTLDPWASKCWHDEYDYAFSFLFHSMLLDGLYIKQWASNLHVVGCLIWEFVELGCSLDVASAATATVYKNHALYV